MFTPRECDYRLNTGRHSLVRSIFVWKEAASFRKVLSAEKVTIMGNALKRIVTKPFRSFNVENRAQRVIEKEKPVQAPRHRSFEDATPPQIKG